MYNHFINVLKYNMAIRKMSEQVSVRDLRPSNGKMLYSDAKSTVRRNKRVEE